ncbi:MAG: putative membrane protein [Candidatus Methanohalarchaeum thermophilum]|uniref:Membrane protein n=1 Tax=Methanohalarchaeum thermophilum TaxID=1903181 RepID=A0A1Q6DXP9_METT1|nr:MAG: putative membrane protein [Candidatus Methanohalarchaeum thermophilum]
MLSNLINLGYSSLIVVLTAFFLLGAIALMRYAVELFEFSGFTPSESLILVLAPLLNLIPISYNLIFISFEDVSLGFNLLGFLIPFYISIRIILSKRIPYLRSLVALAIITFLSYELSTFYPDRGILVYNFYLVPISATFVSILLCSNRLKKIAPLSYFSGTMGILIGADLLRLNEVLLIDYSVKTNFFIGGAGVLDAIFMCGFLSVLLDLVLIFLNPECRIQFRKTK